jgi:hypothetical protein
MDCEATSDRLPWLLNGTLSEMESENARAHLSLCPRCRREMEETRRAAAVFGAHVSTADLVDLAWDRPVAETALVHGHLESCRDCAQDLALARESRAREDAPDLPSRRGAALRFGRYLALPSSLAAGLLLGLWWGGDRAPAPAPTPDPRVPALVAEAARLREASERLQADLEEARAPHVNVPVAELLPANLARRSSDAPPVGEVLVPAGARVVTLLLGGDGVAPRPAALEIRNRQGDVVWSGSGLRAGALGAYTLTVPTALLTEGEYVLTLRPDGARARTYELRVRREGPGAGAPG